MLIQVREFELFVHLSAISSFFAVGSAINWGRSLEGRSSLVVVVAVVSALWFAKWSLDFGSSPPSKGRFEF